MALTDCSSFSTSFLLFHCMSIDSCLAFTKNFFVSSFFLFSASSIALISSLTRLISRIPSLVSVLLIRSLSSRSSLRVCVTCLKFSFFLRILSCFSLSFSFSNCRTF
uniref:Uncharacterized protein n=1 Tax=Cacopsylla melanoneura TaxID=428564 RepID=A0A8D9BI20_9HEMI